MSSRRPDSFDGLPGLSSRMPLDPLLQYRVTTPPDIPGSRNLHRSPTYDDSEAAAEAFKAQAAWEVPPVGHTPAEQLNRFAGFGIGLVSLFTENVLAHPCIVFRRQCQVNVHARCFHLSPFSAVSVMYRISKAQGVRSLWKGMGSTFIVHGVTLGAEGIISEFTPLPRELSHRWSWRQLAGHLLLKGLTAVVALPFYCASLIDTVQSEIVRDDSASLLDCLREALSRLLGLGAPHSRRLLPLTALLFPAAAHAIIRYCVSTCVQRGALWLLQRRRKEEASDRLDSYFLDLSSQWAGSLVSDLVVLPLETVLHRLSLQGTRTIIDHTDVGGALPAVGVAATEMGGAGTEVGGALTVLPVNTQYCGFSDCCNSIRQREGAISFYRGLGALALQYALHAAALALSRAVLRLAMDSKAVPEHPHVVNEGTAACRNR